MKSQYFSQHSVLASTPSVGRQQSPTDSVTTFLTRFAVRQSLLQTIRAFAVSIIAMLLGLCICIGIDSFLKPPEAWRWLLTCTLYASTLGLSWQLGLRSWFFPPNRELSARAVEQALPSLQERLLSAVELRDQDGTIRSGSPVFVEAIEQSVAHELGQLEIEQLLPWKLVAKSLIAVIVTLGILLAACGLPNAKLPQWIARSMLPFVSLERPSITRITILEPSLNALSVPSDQIVQFAIEVSGRIPTEATLELAELDSVHEVQDASIRGTEKRRSLKLLADDDAPEKFSIAAPISDRETKFRILAGDAETIFRTIHPIARPKVIAFHAEVEPPGYTVGVKESRSDSRGDLRALKGSNVRLQVDVNQAVSKANIVMEYRDSGRIESLELTPTKPETANPLSPKSKLRLVTEFPVLEDATYQVKLASAFEYKGNKIENTFSPRYRIDAIEDPEPILTWKSNDRTIWSQAPLANQVFMVSRDEIVNLAVSVADNLPVEKIIHEASVNGGPWSTIQSIMLRSEWTQAKSVTSIATSSSVFASDSWAWDLGSLAAGSGDLIATRVTATDRKGNTAYSPTIQFSVASFGFDRERHRGLYRRAELVPLLQALSDSINTTRDRLRPQLDKLKKAEILADDRTQIINDVRDVVKASVKSAHAFREKAELIMKDIGRCVDQAEVELIVRTATRIEKDWLASLAYGIEADLQQVDAKSDAKSTEWHRREYEKRMDTMLQSYDQACDNSKRCPDIYRQFIGLELLASLTSDLLCLRDHQQNVLNRVPAADFTMLARSQSLSEQYLEALAKVIGDIEPKLNQDLRNRFPELVRWIDQTRTEIKELTQQLASEASAKDLRSRIAQSAAELKNLHWAFNLQGNLTSDVINCRRELLNRSGGLWTHFERFFDRHRHQVDAIKDRSLPTDELQHRLDGIADEVNGPILSAMSQMIDRRDIHQQRTFSDPLFASDMGMAHRAWSSLMDRRVAELSNAAAIFSDAESIARAYRVLEAAHETVQARLVVQSLLPIEQYEWRTTEGQLMSPKQWDSIDVRLDVATRWMAEAGFPKSVTEKYSALRRCEPAQRIQSKLNPRRAANNSNVVSGADEMRTLLSLWSEADREAKPILDNARATLAKFSPTVSELAKQAAVSTQRLKAHTEQLNPNRDDPGKNGQASETNVSSAKAQIQQERRVANHRISQLQDALIELANKQDLLNDDELNAARDSDSSLKLIDAVVPMMDEAIGNVMETMSDVSDDQSERIEEAVRQESKAAEALERIAGHFAMVEELQKDKSIALDLAQSSDELAKLAAASAREYSLLPEAIPLRDEAEDYQRAKELAELMTSEPESLLQKLENELKRNPLMQSELSEISQANAQSLANELRNASKVEEAMAKQLESDDAKLAGEKRLRLNQLRASAEWSERVVARLFDNAAQAAQRSGAKDDATSIENSAAELRRTTQSARQWTDDILASDVAAMAQVLESRFDELQRQIESVSHSIQPRIEQASGRDEKQRQVIQNETRVIQNQSRNELLHQAREFVAYSQRQLDQAKRRLQQSQTAFDNAGKKRLAAQKSLDKEPSNPSFLENHRQASIQVEQALLKKGAEEQLVAQSEALLQHAKDKVAAFERAGRAILDRPNPQAVLAMEQLANAREQLDQLQEQVKSTVELSQKLPQPQTPASTLSSKRQDQQRIQEEVSDVASDIARSSRHEARLENEGGARELARLAESVQALADGSMNQARVSLSTSATAAEQIVSQQLEGSKGDEITERFQRPEARNPRDLLRGSAIELAGQSELLEQQMGALTGSKLAKEDKQSAAGESNSILRDIKQAEARDMARMLDGLDRQLHADSNSSEKSSPGESGSNDTPPSESSLDSASSNGQKSKNLEGDQDRNGTRSALKDSIKSSAEKLAGSMGKDRLNQRAASQSQKNGASKRPSKQLGGGQPGDDLSSSDNAGDFVLPGMTRVPSRDWGKLRTQRAEDAVEGRRDDFDPEFSDAIRAYYKALGNR